MFDLLCGIAPRHIRRLCDSSWEGGNGYTPQQVGNLTLDMAFMLLAERTNLRLGDRKMKTVSAAEVIPMASKDGLIKGRDKDGNPIQARILGRSLASRVRAESEARKKKEREAKSEEEKKSRRKRRGSR